MMSEHSEGGSGAAFGAATTAEEVIAGHDLRGKRVVVTGASSGIGVETARVFAAAGAEVILAVRDPGAGDSTAARIAQDGGVLPRAERLDLSNLASVRAFAAKVAGQPVDILVNNAGVMGTNAGTTADGFELQFGVNHLGHFLLTLLLLPDLIAAKSARVINLSSAAHIWSDVDLDDPHFERRPYHRWLSYGQSKTANILFGVELARRFGERGIRSHAVMPGTIVDTALRRYADAEQRKSMPAFSVRPVELPRVPVKSLGQGAATTVWAALAPELDGSNGLYLEDCSVAEPWSEIDPRRGVKDYALDGRRAAALWAMSEKMVGEFTS